MPSEYLGTRNVKKIHYDMGMRLTEERKIEILKDQFKRRHGYEMNIENPRSFNEKTMWYKLYYQNPLITRCCDKYTVKGYIREVIGEEYFVPNIASWDDPDDIDFDALPDQFVLKVNWSSGYNIIVRDKSKLDIPDTIRKLKQWTKPDRNSYYQFFNWGYKYVKPVIYAEEYLEQVDGQVYDYKFFTFNSQVKWLYIATDRDGASHTKFDVFDRDFNYIPVTYGETHHADPLPEKPRNYEKMIALAEELAKPFPFVRVDFFEVGDRIYVGEMTFYSGGGLMPFEPVEWDFYFGEMFDLPEKMITDKEGLMYKAKVAMAEVGYNVKNALKAVGRAFVKHEKKGKRHYVTLFSFLRFPISVFTLGEWRYAGISDMQIRFKRAKPKEVRNTHYIPAPGFKALEPYQAYMMEDKITLEMKKHYIEQKAYAQLHYFPNLDNPQSWNEKLLWLALYYRNPHHSVASDKARAKQWVAERIGSEYVVPLIGAYENVNDINFDALPDKFVMKANEGWGADEVIVVRDKSKVDIDRLRAHASAWLYPWSSYYYNNMCITDEKPEKPLVVFEELLEDGDKPYLNDYKFYCCNGEVKFILIVTDRGSKNQTRTFVGANWKVLSVSRAGKPSETQAPEKPKNLEKMFELAKILCKDVPLVRIDFYNLDGKIYIGEMTFTPGLFLRFEPKIWDFKLGENLDLTEVMKEFGPGKTGEKSE